MAKHVRIFVILMLAAYTAATVVQTANASAMNIKMALAAIDDANQGICQNCIGGSDNTSFCDDVCISPITAIIPPVEIGMPRVKIATTGTILFDMTGCIEPPDPYPPRFIALNQNVSGLYFIV